MCHSGAATRILDIGRVVACDSRGMAPLIEFAPQTELHTCHSTYRRKIWSEFELQHPRCWSIGPGYGRAPWSQQHPSVSPSHPESNFEKKIFLIWANLIGRKKI